MARRPRVFGPGLLYHVVARGNHREAVFLDHGDYETYLHRLEAYRAKYAVTLHAYCLMPNHVHLVLRTGEASLAHFMQSLQQSYTQRFNRRYGQVGHVFQGRYKALLCETDEYLVTLVRYVHLNPLRAGLVARVEDYRYSGHRAYLRGVTTGFVDPTFVLSLVGGPSEYVRLIASDTVIAGPRTAASRLAEALRADPETARLASSQLREPLDHALSSLARGLLMDIDALRGPAGGRATSRARAVVAYVLVRCRGYRLKDVAAALGRSASTTSLAVRGVSRQLPGDPAAARQVDRLVNALEVKVEA